MIRRMRSMMERPVVMTVVSTASTAMSTAAISALGFSRVREFNAQDCDFDAAIRQFSKQHVDAQILADDNVREGLLLAALAHPGAVSDLKHIGEVIDLERDGLAVFIHGHDFPAQLLLHGFLRCGGRGGSRRCGCWGGRLAILRPRFKSSSQRQQQA